MIVSFPIILSTFLCVQKLSFLNLQFSCTNFRQVSICHEMYCPFSFFSPYILYNGEKKCCTFCDILVLILILYLVNFKMHFLTRFCFSCPFLKIFLIYVSLASSGVHRLREYGVKNDPVYASV